MDRLVVILSASVVAGILYLVNVVAWEVDRLSARVRRLERKGRR